MKTKVYVVDLEKKLVAGPIGVDGEIHRVAFDQHGNLMMITAASSDSCPVTLQIGDESEFHKDDEIILFEVKGTA